MDDSEGVLFPKNISSLGKIQNAKQVAERQEIDSHTLGAVYTMDHGVVPRKRPILRGTTSWDDFHGPSY
jgi:hypothetical protein